MVKKILIGLLIVLIAIQFFRPKKNISTTTSANDITTLYATPTDVQNILGKACYDCHSNNTRYPWYAEVQPVAWWLNDHIEEGKHELNFSEFGTYRLRKQFKRLDGTIELVKKGAMPLKSYTLIHTDAKLTDQEKESLFKWASGIMDTMRAKYPADSLIGPKKPQST
jgi:hypothetical protein